MIEDPFYPSKLMFSSELHSTLAAFSQRTLRVDVVDADMYLSGVLRSVCQSLVECSQSEFNFLCYGLSTLNEVSLSRFATAYAQLDLDQQDLLMLHMELGELPEFSDAPRFYNLLHRLVFKAKFEGQRSVSYPASVSESKTKRIEIALH